MRRKAMNTTIRVALTAAFCAAPASAQQIAGTPGAPSATEIKHRSHLPMPNTVQRNWFGKAVISFMGQTDICSERG